MNIEVHKGEHPNTWYFDYDSPYDGKYRVKIKEDDNLYVFEAVEFGEWRHHSYYSEDIDGAVSKWKADQDYYEKFMADKKCNHKTIHTELIKWAEPNTDMRVITAYIDTYCADCGVHIKRVKVLDNNKV